MMATRFSRLRAVGLTSALLGFLAAAASLPSGRVALAAQASQAAAPDVLLLSPRTGKPLFGEVEIVAEIFSTDPLGEVIFRVDGREVARRTAPPWRAVTDVGQENQEHHFEVVAVTVGGVEGRAERSTPPIAVDAELDLELQQLYITVSRGDERVLDLERQDFVVLDDGLGQQIVTFERGDVPLTAALLVDASSSMKGGRLRLAVRGARRFVEEMKPLDEAMLLLFSDRLLYDSSFTDDPSLLTDALSTITAQGGTAIHDHLYLALKRLEARQGRRVVILLTDGIDIESSLAMEDVRWVVRRSQALVYWIRLRGDEGDRPVSRFTSWRGPEAHQREVELLGRTVEESGGRIVDIAELEEAEEVFGEILHELRDQYVVGYYPSASRNDGSWHDVKIRVPGGLVVRTREGYIDF